MKKHLLITIEVEVSDLTKAEKADLEEGAMCSADEMPGVADCEPSDVGNAIAESLPINEELFAGTGLYIRLQNSRLISAQWKP